VMGVSLICLGILVCIILPVAGYLFSRPVKKWPEDFKK
jgi:hypothetical protein